MSEKKVVRLDLTGCKYLEEIHERIRLAFDFPEWYGRNWDAFWDSLWSHMEANRVEIMGESKVPENLKREISVMNRLLEDMKRDCSKYENPEDHFEYEVID